MIFKYPNGQPFELYVVTGELLTALSVQAVPFDGFKKIHAYHDKLTFGEVASFVACHMAAARIFGVDMPEPQTMFGDDAYNAGMLAEAFNAIDSNKIAEILRGGHEFHSTVIGQVIVVAVDAGSTGKVHSWEKLKAKTLGSAVLETIYARVGYLEAHFGKIIKPNLGDLTLAEVYKLVHLQNP